MSEEQQKPTLAELLHAHVDNQIKNKYDYSTATARKQDIQNFISNNKNNLKPEQLSIKLVRSSYNPILEKKLKESGIDPEKVLKKNTKLKFNKNLNAKITPETQTGANDETPTGKPQLQGQQGAQIGIAPPPAYNEESVSATFSALILPLKIAYPEIELLTDKEKEALGKMWLPAFNLYLADQKYAVIGIPLFATLGIFIPKIVEGRKKHMIKQSKEEGQARQEEISDGIVKRPESEIPEKQPEKIPDSGEPVIGSASEKLVLPQKEN